MESLLSFNMESVHDEKVKILNDVYSLNVQDILIGQYRKSEDGDEQAYLEARTVNLNIKCITFGKIICQIQKDRYYVFYYLLTHRDGPPLPGLLLNILL